MPGDEENYERPRDEHRVEVDATPDEPVTVEEKTTVDAGDTTVEVTETSEVGGSLNGDASN